MIRFIVIIGCVMVVGLIILGVIQLVALSFRVEELEIEIGELKKKAEKK